MEIMARLGVRTVDDMKGRVDLLVADDAAHGWKARFLDLSPILKQVERDSSISFFTYDSTQVLVDWRLPL